MASEINVNLNGINYYKISNSYFRRSSSIMTALLTSAEMDRSPGFVAFIKQHSWLLFFIALISVLSGGVYIAQHKYYTSGDDFGYYLGLVGALLMLSLLLFPLRKRTRFMQGWGKLSNWFRVHMIIGITGPLLILFHANFRFGSINAGVALASMLLVAASGILGRFVYTKIHHGLYGRSATLKEIKAHFIAQSDDIKTKFHFAPHIEKWLLDFESYALDDALTISGKIWRFVSIAVQARWLHRKSIHALKLLLSKRAHERDWDDAKLTQRLALASRMAEIYLKQAQAVAQFSTYEHIFALWHVLHIPLVYMLVLSSVFHVVAVHMY